jgi:hypothetical protein
MVHCLEIPFRGDLESKSDFGLPFWAFFSYELQLKALVSNDLPIVRSGRAFGPPIHDRTAELIS